jgi:glucosamine--fructose-6-phosphate aminotransferase (isomerizing)
VLDPAGRRRRPALTRVAWQRDAPDKNGFTRSLLKEIREQPTAAADTLSHWHAQVESGDGELLFDALLQHVERVVIVGGGTSYHAGLAGRLAIERWARLPVDVEVASEFRYREPILAPRTLVLGVSQSGETADTLAAMRLARERGAIVVAVTNVPGSSAMLQSHAALFTRAAPEIGVAATRTFIAQVVLLYAFALRLAEIRSGQPSAVLSELSAALELLPGQMASVLESSAPAIEAIAERLAPSPFFLDLGGLCGLPVALEGAMKLKEISYVPTDTHPAGEITDDLIALLSPDTPVICVATEEAVLPKLLWNLAEVRARRAQVIAVATRGYAQIREHAEDVVYVPRADPVLQIPLAVIPLQLLAFHVARYRGLKVDHPGNVAKTVAVQ